MSTFIIDTELNNDPHASLEVHDEGAYLQQNSIVEEDCEGDHDGDDGAEFDEDVEEVHHFIEDDEVIKVYFKNSGT